MFAVHNRIAYTITEPDSNSFYHMRATARKREIPCRVLITYSEKNN